MKREIKIIFILIIIINFFSSSIAQDLHFSQYYTSPLNLNPAQTGVFKGDYRFCLNGKSQWQSVTVPYQTISISFDMPAYKRKYHKDAIGAGIVINTDIAGDSHFSTTYPAISASYIRMLDRNAMHLLSAGVQFGYYFRSIKYSELYFDNQFNGNYYDPNLGNNEIFNRMGYSYADLGLGINYIYLQSRDRNYFAGVSLSHLMRPQQSFMGDNEIKLDMKLISYAGAEIGVSPVIDAIPEIMFMDQGQYRELLIGIRGKYIQNRYSILEYTSINAGIFYRNKDAMVFTTGFDYKQFSFGLSYDMNVSKLRPASSYRGGLEFSLIYIYSKSQYVRAKQIACPIF